VYATDRYLPIPYFGNDVPYFAVKILFKTRLIVLRPRRWLWMN